MLQYLKHQFRLVRPLIAFFAAVVFVLSLGRLLVEVVIGPRTSSLRVAQMLGDGLDEFSMLLGASVGALFAGIAQFAVWVAMIAFIATAITVMSAVRQLSHWVHGPSDIGAFARHMIDRARRATRISATPIAWGVVHDAHSGHPLPLARVSLLDARGSIIASMVADTAGRYGFHAPAQYARVVAGVHVRKDGYFMPRGASAVLTATMPTNLDVPMEKLHEAVSGVARGEHPVMCFVQSAAFWSGMVAVPVAYALAPSRAGVLLIALFACAAIVRAVGSGSHHSIS